MDTFGPVKGKLPFTKKILPSRVILSYTFDYAIILVLLVLFFAIDKTEGFHQHFSLNNYTLQYPFAKKERIPVFWLCIIVVLVPAGIIIFFTMVVDGLFSHHQATTPSGRRRRKYKLKDRLWELNCGILGLLLAVGAAFTITGTLKNAIGKPRPDLIDRCQPIPGSQDPVPAGLSSDAICTQTDKAILQDGFRSFPSGHSSTAFAGLFYLSLWLGGRLHVLDSRGEVWKTFILLVPTLGAALIAGSRIMDARHHPFDVISGSMLGVLVAWGSYRQYYPPLHKTELKGRAYPIRTWGRDPAAYHPSAAQIQSEMGFEARYPTDEENSAQGFYKTSSTSAIPLTTQPTQRRQAPVAYPGGARDTLGAPSPDHHDRPAPYPPPHLAPPANPFGDHSAYRRDGYSSSSSDEDEYDNGTELQPAYTLSNPQQGVQPYDPTKHSSTAPYVAHDTAYHTPTQLQEATGSRTRDSGTGGDLGMARTRESADVEEGRGAGQLPQPQQQQSAPASEEPERRADGLRRIQLVDG